MHTNIEISTEIHYTISKVEMSWEPDGGKGDALTLPTGRLSLYWCDYDGDEDEGEDNGDYDGDDDSTAPACLCLQHNI